MLQELMQLHSKYQGQGAPAALWTSAIFTSVYLLTGCPSAVHLLCRGGGRNSSAAARDPALVNLVEIHF